MKQSGAPAPQLLLLACALLTVLAAGSQVVPTLWAVAPAGWHGLFALGALPMIFAALGYFVPVLTRTGPTPRLLAALPLLGLLTGASILLYFLGILPSARLWAPWLGLFPTLGLAFWIWHRCRACLGQPHPGLAWYAVALGFLALGLAAVGVSALIPALSGPLRLFHLHANLLGFMGITALGTLQVLLPTVAGGPDPAAAERLRRHLAPVTAGVLLIAVGAAGWPPLAVIGALLYLWPWAMLLRNASRLLRRHGSASALPLLAAALAGLGLALGHGMAHGLGLAPGRAALPLYAIGFLLPLVSGALTQLLPIWLRPGPQREWHPSARRQLAWGAGLRGALLPVAGMMAATGYNAGLWIAGAAALWLLVVALKLLARP